jgi:hypothetical protein
MPLGRPALTLNAQTALATLVNKLQKQVQA